MIYTSSCCWQWNAALNSWFKGLWKPIKSNVLLAVQQMWPVDISVGKFEIDVTAAQEVFTLNLESGGH
jgi:hypothetical protein